MRSRLAILASRPIAYQAPWLRLLATQSDIEVKVFFEEQAGVGPHYDPEYGTVIEWDLPLTEGYGHVFIKSWPSFLRELRGGKFDALMVHAWNSPLVWICAAWCKVVGLPLILRAENPWSHELAKPVWQRVARRILLGAIFFRCMDAFCYIGEENKLLYLNYGVPARKLFFTPYAVETDRFLSAFHSLPSKPELRRALGVPEGAVMFFSVAKLIQKKRPLDIVKAYESLTWDSKALVLAGEGELRPELEKYIKERRLKGVILAGFVGQKDIPRYYAAADVFVLASGVGETWGVVVNEAMCFGLPVVAANLVGSAKDLVHPGENGFIFPSGNIGALAQALQSLAASSEMRATFGAASRAIVEHYSSAEDVRGIRAALEGVGRVSP